MKDEPNETYIIIYAILSRCSRELVSKWSTVNCSSIWIVNLVKQKLTRSIYEKHDAVVSFKRLSWISCCRLVKRYWQYPVPSNITHVNLTNCWIHRWLHLVLHVPFISCVEFTMQNHNRCAASAKQGIGLVLPDLGFVTSVLKCACIWLELLQPDT